MMVVAPAGATAAQMKAEQPTTTYDMFVRNMICEEARPLNMPYNIAACDSSGYSYSGGQLDHQTYFVAIGVDRQDCESEVLNKIFTVWFEQAVEVYGWTRGPGFTPKHGWNWNKKPQNDPSKTANARKTNLSTGATLLSDIYAEDGEDYEDKIVQMADNFGKTVAEMKEALFKAAFPSSVQQQQTTLQPTEDKNNEQTEQATPPGKDDPSKQ
jgi:capsid protein